MAASAAIFFVMRMNQQRQSKANDDYYDTMIKNQQVQRQIKTNFVNGFIVDSSQTNLAKWIFETYPETVANVQSRDQQVRTYYMNILFRIHEMVYHKKTSKFSDSKLRKASKGLSSLTKAGFEVEWLRSKLDEMVSLKRKEREACEARIVELKQEMKKLEVMMSGLKVELKNEKAKLKTL